MFGAVRLGAVSSSSVPVPGARAPGGARTVMARAAVEPSLITTTRIVPSGARVANARSCLPWVCVTLSSRDPAGAACANSRSP